MNVKTSPFLFKGGAYRGPTRYTPSDREPISPGCMDQLYQKTASAKIPQKLKIAPALPN